MLVQNTVDHHLYEWWITPQGQLTGIDLGPNWINVQAIGAPQHYNNNSPYDQLLIHNTSDGNFYQWWISNNTLTGVNLGPSFSATAFGASSAAGSTTPGSTPSAGPTVSSPAVDTSLSTTPDSTSLLVQAMASFGTNGLLYNSSGAPLGTDPSQQSPLAAPVDQHLAHG
jgi:hypothetical protein